MSAIGKGDWVQCIDPACEGYKGMTLGGVYCVEAIDPSAGDCENCGDVGDVIDLVGIPRDLDAGFCFCQFRPLGGNAKTLTAPPVRQTVDA